MKLFLHAFIIIILVLSGCGGEDNGVPTPPAPPVFPGSPSFISPSSIDGQYVIRFQENYFYCDGENVEGYNVVYSIADVVEQEDPYTFDLLSRFSSYDDFSQTKVVRDQDGFFKSEYSYGMTLWPLNEITFIFGAEGSVGSNSLAFTHTALVGVTEKSGEFHPVCEGQYEAVGFKRHLSWTGNPRAGYDGEWIVSLEILEDTEYGPGEPRNMIVDTMPTSDDPSVLKIETPYVDFYGIEREADGSIPEVTFQYSELTEISLKGFVLNDSLELDITWVNTQNGQVTYRHVEKIKGVPRFEPPVLDQPAPVLGTYTAKFVETDNTCGEPSGPLWYRVEVLPADDNKLAIWIAGVHIPPVVVAENGAFTAEFWRYNDWAIKYVVNGIIGSRQTAISIHTEAYSPDAGEYICGIDYGVTGKKRYQSYFAPIE